MNTENFWSIVNNTLEAKTIDQQLEILYSELNELSIPELLSFHETFLKKMDESYTWELWAAAHIIHGDCPEDAFIDFRAWLIFRGRAIFDAAVKDANSLAKIGKKALLESFDGEEFNYMAAEVYEEKTGKDIEDDENLNEVDFKDEPTGQEWEEDDLNTLVGINPDIYELFKSDWE